MPLGSTFTINYIDFSFCIILLIFCLVGLFRGLVAEIASSLNWIISFLFSFFLTPPLSRIIAPYFKIGILLDISVRVALFFACFLLIFFTTSGSFKNLRDKISPLIDRPLGMIFGFAKTMFLLGAAYSIYAHIFDFISLGKNSEIAIIESGRKGINQSADTLAVEKLQPSNDNSDLTSPINSNENQSSEKSINSKTLATDDSTLIRQRSKFPEYFLKAKCVNYIVFSGRAIDPVLKPIYVSLVKNYGDSIKNKIFKEIEKSVLDRVMEKENSGNIEDTIKESPPKSEIDNLIKKIGSSNSEFYINNNSANDNQGNQPYGDNQKDSQGYEKNEIQKKERMMDIINQQGGR